MGLELRKTKERVRWREKKNRKKYRKIEERKRMKNFRLFRTE